MKATIAILIALLIIAALYVRSQDGAIRINKQQAVFFMLKDGYRSWGVSYSHGEYMGADGKLENLWRWPPMFFHIDFHGTSLTNLVLYQNK